MKKLILFFTVAVLMVSCAKHYNAPAAQFHFTDHELVNREMDSIAKVTAVQLKGKPVRPPKPGDQPPPKPGDQPPPINVGDACLLITFDGHDEVGMFGNFHCNGSGLSATDITAITERVKHDYSFFTGVIVTTDENIYNSYPQNKRRRCIVTTSYEWYPAQVGGVSYIGSLKWFDNTSCFVFSSMLGYNSRYIADAISHEFGHVLSLRHQSTWVQSADGTWTKTSEYNWGNADEAPIEGASYYAILPRWWIGYNSVFIWQDDMLFIIQFLKQ